MFLKDQYTGLQMLFTGILITILMISSNVTPRTGSAVTGYCPLWAWLHSHQPARFCSWELTKQLPRVVTHPGIAPASNSLNFGVPTNPKPVSSQKASPKFRVAQRTGPTPPSMILSALAPTTGPARVCSWELTEQLPRGSPILGLLQPLTRLTSEFLRTRSQIYLEMERLFKIYVYEEGDPPIFHNGPCKSIGRFIHEMEMDNNIYKTTDPDEALVYFLPFSVVMLVQYLYAADSHNTDSIGRAVIDYVNQGRP
ncbi:hypothetical protein L3X38_029653 [Prunus dulcis]|uniref:Uncharacterized protein n=1 Tax=Prunus dulcis TaxID=3755 RepID=A0AAD4VS07_PRUDU|nr:hypothetical protein L3X38_029653 [Prunus dulcis]